MLLTEAVGKHLLRTARISTAQGVVVPDEAGLNAHSDWSFPVAAKAQVASGGRGKAGGVVSCANQDELVEAFRRIMATEFSGEYPSGILVEPWLTIDRELYLSVVVDPAVAGYAVLYSPTGGVDIESAERVVSYGFGHPEDFRGHELRKVIATVEEDEGVRERVVDLARNLVRLAQNAEATTVEVNPLAVCQGKLIAADAKVVLDDSAEYRNAHTAKALAESYEREDEVSAACRAARLVFVPLGGSVGLFSGGAGMTMRAMDAVSDAGGSAAGFLDISNNPTPDGVSVALESLQRLEGVDRILISIFGGGLDVGRIAKTLCKLIDDGQISVPIAFRLAGSGTESATEQLAARGLTNHSTLEAAVEELLAKESNR